MSKADAAHFWASLAPLEVHIVHLVRLDVLATLISKVPSSLPPAQLSPSSL